MGRAQSSERTPGAIFEQRSCTSAPEKHSQIELEPAGAAGTRLQIAAGGRDVGMAKRGLCLVALRFTLPWTARGGHPTGRRIQDRWRRY